MKINRKWEMPNSCTFNIKCVNKFIHTYINKSLFVIDPFANKSKLAKITNDLNPNMPTDYHLDALEFLTLFDPESIDVVLYDPPYSKRQVVECYQSVGIEVTNETTQSSWRAKHLNQISRILKPGGYCLSFGWNSNGIGIKRGFEIKEILLVAHGSEHHDTICMAEQKIKGLFDV